MFILMNVFPRTRLPGHGEFSFLSARPALPASINQAADDFLDWLNRFSNNHGVKFTVSVSGDPGLATDGMQKYL